MKTKKIFLSIAILFCFSLVYAQFAGGDGTLNDPWQISTPSQLDGVRNYLGSANSDKHFILINNIDLNVPPYNTGDGWDRIGDAANQFTGHFDGDDYVISFLFIDRPTTWYVGLFGYVGASGVITNLHLDCIDVTGYSSSAGLVGNNAGSITNSSVGGYVSGYQGVGAIAGENNLGTIDGCHSQGTIYSLGNNGGGLVGRNRLSSTIINSYSTSEVIGIGNNSYGGLIGWNDSVISDCYATGNVNGALYTGGLVGRNYRGSITNSYATGNVVSTTHWIGGLVGGNGGLFEALIIDSYATGAVQGNASVGGLVGENNNHGIITNCYALGSVYGSNQSTSQFGAAGLVGELRIGATVEYSYSVGHVSGNPPLGGLIGYDRGGTVLFSYWNTETSNQNTSAGGLGLTTEQMVMQNSFQLWDFNDVWQIIELLTYPYLQNNPQTPPPSPYTLSLILVTPESFDIVAEYDELVIDQMIIQNLSNVSLTFQLIFDDFLDRERVSENEYRENWVYFNPQNGTIEPGESIEIEVIFDATILDAGIIYLGAIIVYNNVEDDVNVPVTMEVLMPVLPAPTNLQVDSQTGLFTWDAPELNLSGVNRIDDRQELMMYHIYLDDVGIDTTEETFYQFEDLVINQEYTAGVQAVYDIGLSEIATISFVYEGVNVDIPFNTYTTELLNNYPNPFNPETTISFSLQESSSVSIIIYDIRGALITKLVDSIFQSGHHNVLWNGKNNSGHSVPSGLYFYRMETDDYQETKKMLLLK
ncbi:MAG: T9SS type A sorting domain-containing protein [Candidatus Cloacimonetes bacterium]|nr:T9SS type A sorting domain-containing protein [Candidatus Cloacimonadota bacterium]